MDEKPLYAHILNLTAPWQVKSLSLDENAGSVTVTVGIAENARLWPVRPAVNPVLFTITVIVNGVILIPASSPLLSKPMCPALCARSMAARRCQFPGLAPEAGIRCCSNRSFSHG